MELTYHACGIALHQYQIPVKILTKRTDWVDDYLGFMENSNSDNEAMEWRKNIAFGFTLTGHDELEPNASTNTERIEAMQKLHKAGFKTFASIEPVIEFWSSYEIMKDAIGYCDLYKVGLESGKKYKSADLKYFVKMLKENFDAPVYFKDSLLKAAGINREDLPANCVGRDYNLFQ
jgi:DNA repair photolyase